MNNAYDNTVPFLTRFFRAWADDLDVGQVHMPGVAADAASTDEAGTPEKR